MLHDFRFRGWLCVEDEDCVLFGYSGASCSTKNKAADNLTICQNAKVNHAPAFLISIGSRGGKKAWSACPMASRLLAERQIPHPPCGKRRLTFRTARKAQQAVCPSDQPSSPAGYPTGSLRLHLSGSLPA